MKLSTDHSASSYGMPVLVNETGRAYGPLDIVESHGDLGDLTARDYVRSWSTDYTHRTLEDLQLAGLFLGLDMAETIRARNAWHRGNCEKYVW